MKPRFTWPDLLVALFLVAFLAAIGSAQLVAEFDTAAKAKCASNLHQIGLAILLYQGDNQQLYPQTAIDKAEDHKPTWGTPYQAKHLGTINDADPFKGEAAVDTNDVTASFFLLIRNEQIGGTVFECPATSLRPWDFGGGANSALNWSNWPGNRGLARFLSYSYQNPFANNSAIKAGCNIKNPDATYAVAADMNPGGDAVKTVTVNSSAEEMQKANSLNHDQQGQNVLYGDGHAEFQNNPFCGTEHDNIYTAAGPEIKDDARKTAVILASPVSGTDSILLPTAADIGYKFTAPGQPLNAADRAKLKASLLGNYTATINGADATMTLDATSFTCTTNRGYIEYTWQDIGASGDTLVANFTAKDTDTHERATLCLQDGVLTINTTQDSRLDYEWKREK